MFKKIKEYFNQKDKLQHWLLASYITNVCIILLLFFLPLWANTLWANILLSTVFTTIICGVKEYIDSKPTNTHVANINDFYAGLIGIVIIDLQWLIFFVLYKFLPIFV